MCELSLEALPSTPKPTGQPARLSASTGAQPDPNRIFDVGQCAIPTPALPNRLTSALLKKMPCASHVSPLIHPASSSKSSGRLPNRLKQYACSSRVSARCVCSLTPCRRASSPLARIN